MSFANPQKNFRYALEFLGVNMFLAQEFTPPTVETDVVEHGSPGNLPNGKTPGKMRVGEMVLKKLKPATAQENWAWDWFSENITGLKTQFARSGFLTELGPDGFTPVRKYFCGDMWVSKIEPGAYDSKGSENVMETITIQPFVYYPTDSPQFTAIFGGTAAAGFAGTIGNAG